MPTRNQSRAAHCQIHQTQKFWLTVAFAKEKFGTRRALVPPWTEEEHTTSNGINAASLGANAQGTAAVTKAFDDLLTVAQVLAIAAPFTA